jgi:hypothetical protein
VLLAPAHLLVMACYFLAALEKEYGQSREHRTEVKY